jgi:hypothetical protein
MIESKTSWCRIEGKRPPVANPVSFGQLLQFYFCQGLVVLQMEEKLRKRLPIEFTITGSIQFIFSGGRQIFPQDTPVKRLM